MDYFKNRYFSTSLGRFICRDPVKGIHLYQFVGARPIYQTDPDGRVPQAAIAAVVGAVTICAGGHGVWGLFADYRGTHDKFLHCLVSCRIARNCTWFASFFGMQGFEVTTGALAEIGKMIGAPAPGVFEWEDFYANFDGLECAGPETALPVVSWCAWIWREGCWDCCESKWPAPPRIIQRSVWEVLEEAEETSAFPVAMP